METRGNGDTERFLAVPELNTKAENLGSESRIPVAVIGVGHMGRHHVRIYHELPEAELVGVVDADRAQAEAVAGQYQAPAFTSVEPLLGRIKAATVAVPTVAHLAVAGPLLERGVAVLIEKPLAPDSATCRRLIDAARAGGALLQVGHSERFNPVVRAMDPHAGPAATSSKRTASARSHSVRPISAWSWT